MRSRTEIYADIRDKLDVQKWDGTAVRQSATIEILLDIRDLLSERHTRREKGKEVCGECGGKGWTVDYKETETNDPRITSNRLTPVKVPCSCQPAKNTGETLINRVGNILKDDL